MHDIVINCEIYVVQYKLNLSQLSQIVIQNEFPLCSCSPNYFDTVINKVGSATKKLQPVAES